MKAERLRNSLLSALSHDLRTPLTALLGARRVAARWARRRAHAEQRGRCDPRAGPAHQRAGEQPARHGAAAVRRREAAAGMAVARGDRRQRARGLGDRARRTRGLGGICRRTCRWSRCDAMLIERVLVNLLENAAKYTPAGSRIEIAARVDGSEVRVDVADNGKGVPAGMETAIFEKFARGNSESAIPGLGLGLAICRTIVDRARRPHLGRGPRRRRRRLRLHPAARHATRRSKHEGTS